MPRKKRDGLSQAIKAVGEMKQDRAKVMKKIARVPVGADSKFEFEGRDQNFFYYVVNSRRPGRLQKFINAGYEFCYDEHRERVEGVAETTQMDSRVTMDMGHGDVGYLMRLPMELHLQDVATKRDKTLAIEAQMKPNKSKNQYGSGLIDA